MSLACVTAPLSLALSVVLIDFSCVFIGHKKWPFFKQTLNEGKNQKKTRDQKCREKKYSNVCSVGQKPNILFYTQFK